MDHLFTRIAEHWMTEDGWDIEARVYWRQDTNQLYLEVPRQTVVVPDYDDDMNVVGSVEEVVEYGVYFVAEMKPETKRMPAFWYCHRPDTNALPSQCILIPTTTKPRKRLRWAELS